MGADHVCGLDNLNAAYCWGRGTEGQLGTGDLSNRMTPTPVSTGKRWTILAAGALQTCGLLLGTNSVICWGDNSWGQLGVDGVRLVPGSSTSTRNKFVTAGGYHTCVINLENFAACWGLDTDGQTGTNCCGLRLPGEEYSHNEPHRVKGPYAYSTISAG